MKQNYFVNAAVVVYPIVPLSVFQYSFFPKLIIVITKAKANFIAKKCKKIKGFSGLIKSTKQLALASKWYGSAARQAIVLVLLVQLYLVLYFIMI